MSTSNLSVSGKPAIVAPVMRYLRVADPARSVGFYRDVLGFDVRDVQAEYGVPAVAEVVRGPARLQLGPLAATSGAEPARDPAIVFFETDDVAAMHAAIRAGGGTPSEPEKVNWIKMWMFEIRDPDGHTLWFGQSYGGSHHSPHEGRRMFRKIMPELPLDDVAAGIAHYRDVLGFSINYQQDDLGVMDRDDVRLLLIARSARHQGIGSAYVYVDEADALHAELRVRGANLQGEPISQPWGLREFQVLDPAGNRITFGQPFE